MPKRKAKAEPEPEPEPEEPEEDDDDDGDDGDDDESDDDDDDLDLEEADGAPIDLEVEFGFYDPRAEDFHSLRALLAAGEMVPPSAELDLGGLADLLAEQAAVGTIVRGGDAESDIFGFMSAINLQAHREVRCVQQLTAYVLKQCADESARAQLRSWLADGARPLGLVLSERMVNMPTQLVPNLVDALMQDLAWAVENEETEAGRAAFRFDRLLWLARVAPGGGGGGGGGSSSDMGPPAALGKKEKKRAKAAAARDSLSGLQFGRLEEEILAQSAEASWVLGSGGKGGGRLLLMALAPDAVRAALPALHTVMGEA